MEEIKLKFSQVSRKYGIKILELMLEQSNLSPDELCKSLAIATPNVTNIMNKLVQKGLITKEREGKYVCYSLSEEVNKAYKTISCEGKQINRTDLLRKTLFYNMLINYNSNPYVSYLLTDIDYTFSYFTELELEMLIFVLGIYNYEESQSFSNLFGIDEIETIKVQQELLNKFQTFLFNVVQKYNIAIANEERRMP